MGLLLWLHAPLFLVRAKDIPVERTVPVSPSERTGQERTNPVERTLPAKLNTRPIFYRNGLLENLRVVHKGIPCVGIAG